MPQGVRAAASALRTALSHFDAERFSAGDCAALADELARTEKACGAARLLAAARAVECGAHNQRGFRDGPSWMATQLGDTASQARQALETARGLATCPETKTALLEGAISLSQAGEITRAEGDAPGGEAELVEVAKEGDLSTVRERAQKQRAKGLSPEELSRRQRKARDFRHWKDGRGMVRLSGALPPEAGVAVVHRLEAAAQRLHRAAKGKGEDEAFSAHAADALVELVLEGKAQGGTRAELVVVCDLFAWRRGHAHPGEVCQIIDGGPVPLQVARELSKDAFLKAVLHDGVNIHSVKHFGRHLPAALRTALDLGPVPAFTGAQCADCQRRYGLEWDHVDPVANHGPTEYQNLVARCWPDHQDKTERDRRAGLLGRRAKNKSP